MICKIFSLWISRYYGQVSLKEKNKEQGNYKAPWFTSNYKKIDTNLLVGVRDENINITLHFCIRKTYFYSKDLKKKGNSDDFFQFVLLLPGVQLRLGLQS